MFESKFALGLGFLDIFVKVGEWLLRTDPAIPQIKVLVIAIFSNFLQKPHYFLSQCEQVQFLSMFIMS